MHQPKVTHIDILGMSKVRMDCAQQWVGALWQIPWIIQVHVHSHPFSFSTCREPAAQEMFPLLPVQTMLSSVSAYHICKWQSTSCSPCIKIYCAQWPLSLSARKNKPVFSELQFFTRHRVAFCALAVLSALATHLLWSQLAGLAMPSEPAGIGHLDKQMHAKKKHTHTTWLPVGASGSCFVSTVSSSKKNTSWSIDLTRFQNNLSLHLQIKEADFIMFLLDLNWREDLCIVIFVIFVSTSCDCDSFLGAVRAPCSWHHPHDNPPILRCSLQLKRRKRRPLRELSGNQVTKSATQGSESMLCQLPNMYDGCIVLV